MATKRLFRKSSAEQSKPRSLDSIPEVAIAAITSLKNQTDAKDFIDFVVSALDRNSPWLNCVVHKQITFKCALLIGAGPNRFQIKDVIYPVQETPFKLELELQDSDDFDKIGIAALVKMTNNELTNLLDYMRYRLAENSLLREDIMAGKSMGVSYVVLTRYSDNIFRVTDRFIFDSSGTLNPRRKRKKSEPIMSFKKIRRVS